MDTIFLSVLSMKSKTLKENHITAVQVELDSILLFVALRNVVCHPIIASAQFVLALICFRRIGASEIIVKVKVVQGLCSKPSRKRDLKCSCHNI